MQTLFVGQNLIELQEVDSTNNFAATLVNTTNIIDGTVIMAYRQFAGKGQRGNNWFSESGKNLTFSVVLGNAGIGLGTFPNFDLSKATALAISDYLTEKHGLNAQLKWPNDVFVGGRKIAGILIEFNYRGVLPRYAIVGVGLNVNQIEFSDLPKATSLKSELATDFEVKEILKDLLFYTEKRCLQLRYEKGRDELHNNYLNSLVGFGREVDYMHQEQRKRGVITGLTPDGELEIECAGVVQKFEMKEIKLLL
jgi:BirA family transcriptional regulator, biotin operon repressor / biotin---[acetyl-CoA-carboxylase] ligase